MQKVKEEIRSFVITNFLLGREQTNLADDDSFLELGIIDSTGMLELIGFLDKTYGIQVSDQEFLPENLDSISNLVGFLERKRQGDEAGTQLAGA